MRVISAFVFVITVLLASCGSGGPAGTISPLKDSLTTYQIQTKTVTLENGCKAYMTAYLAGDQLVIDIGQTDIVHGSFTPMLVGTLVRFYDENKQELGESGFDLMFDEQGRISDTKTSEVDSLLIVRFSARVVPDDYGHSHEIN